MDIAYILNTQQFQDALTVCVLRTLIEGSVHNTLHAHAVSLLPLYARQLSKTELSFMKNSNVSVSLEDYDG